MLQKIGQSELLTVFCNFHLFRASLYNHNTGIPLFKLLMWGRKKKTAKAKKPMNRGYLVVLKGRKIDRNINRSKLKIVKI